MQPLGPREHSCPASTQLSTNAIPPICIDVSGPLLSIRGVSATPRYPELSQWVQAHSQGPPGRTESRNRSHGALPRQHAQDCHWPSRPPERRPENLRAPAKCPLPRNQEHRQYVRRERPMRPRYHGKRQIRKGPNVETSKFSPKKASEHSASSK